MTILFLLLGLIAGITATVGIIVVFLKSHDLRLLLVDSDGPGLAVTHEDLNNRFITSRPNGGSFPVGKFMKPTDLPEVELGLILAKKNPILLRNIVEPAYPQYFSVYSVNQSMSNLINVLGTARDSRRTKQIDTSINLIWAYANDINNYYKWLERKKTDNLFTGKFIGDFSSYNVVPALSKIVGQEESLNIFNSLFKPWDNVK